MADLITLAYAKRRINQSLFTTSEDSLIVELISACSKFIKKLCAREFDSQSFDELYDGLGQDKLLLREFPIRWIDRLTAEPTPVLNIINTLAANDRATIQLVSNVLYLQRVSSGTTATNALAPGNYATFTALAAAINALGNGWSATAHGTYATWPPSYLRQEQGMFTAKNVAASLKLHVKELADFSFDANKGWLRLNSTVNTGAGFWGGSGYWRVQYTAGFATVPEGVQEATAAWVGRLFWQSKRDPGITSQSIAGASSISVQSNDTVPDNVYSLIRPYRKIILGC